MRDPLREAERRYWGGAGRSQGATRLGSDQGSGKGKARTGRWPGASPVLLIRGGIAWWRVE